MKKSPKLVRITTVPISLDKLLHNQLRFMQQYFDVTAISSDETELKQVALTQGVAYKTIAMTRKITPLQDFISLIRMFVFLKKLKPEIVHTHTPKAGIIGMLASKMAGVPHRLHTVAGLPLMETKGTKRLILNFVEKLTYRCATQVYPNSNGLQTFILDQKLAPKNKCKVIGQGSSNGIDIDFFDPQRVSDHQKNALLAQHKILPHDFVFIFVGRLVADKGINELVAAFTQVAKINSNCKLLLVGPFESDLDPLSVSTLSQIQTHPAIIHAGYQNDVRPYFAISHCLVFPSYREGFPNVVMQAGAMQLPVIATNINGCNEIITQHVNGLLIAVKNVAAIAESMQQMLDKKRYEILRVNSRKMIVKRYEQKYIWGQILTEYNELLKHV